MKATLVADASFQDKDTNGGWAGALVILDEAPIQFSGYLPKVESSTEAELIALGNAICTAIRKGRLKRGDVLTAYSDCMHAVWHFGGGKTSKGLTHSEQIVVDEVFDFCHQKGVVLKTNHVKGHTSSQAFFARLNAWCDHTAKAAQVAYQFNPTHISGAGV